jgi:DNA mismatch endonuclease (patch repair protein)
MVQVGNAVPKLIAKAIGRAYVKRIGRRRGESRRRTTMADRLTERQRSSLMSRIRTKHTGPELKVRSVAHGSGYRFSLHRDDLPGKPDIVFPRYRSVVFVHGCFWHQHAGCQKSAMPAARREFWTAKLSRNVVRDAENRRGLRRAGWRVLVIWECQTRERDVVARKLKRFLGGPTSGHRAR